MQGLREGLYVKHGQYGLGTITETDEERTTIEFESHGKKKFVTGLMSVEPAGESPAKPAKRRRKKVFKPKAGTSPAN